MSRGIGNVPGGNDSGTIAVGRWTDLSTGATFTKIGANSKPDFDYTNLGLLFPQNDTSEKVYITNQMPHEKKYGSVLKLHIHFVQTSALVPVFEASVRFYNNGVAIPNFASISTVGRTLAFTYPGSGSILNIVTFPDIAAPTGESASANIDIIIHRNDNVITGDVLVKFIDLHYLKDSAGTREEFIK